MNRYYWRKCKGWWPRRVRYLCHHGPPWLKRRAKEYAADRVSQEEQDEHMQAILSLTMQTGTITRGTVGEDGVFRMTAGNDEDTVYVILPGDD